LKAAARETALRLTSERAAEKQYRMATHISIFRKMDQLPEPQQWDMYGILEVHFEKWKCKRLISEATSKD
jgi:hypothetical protein